MIIDTDTPEGRALVALAKFGKWALDTSRECITDVDAVDIEEKAEEIGLLLATEVTEENVCGADEMSDGCDCEVGGWCYKYTDLAKLPEGL